MDNMMTQIKKDLCNNAFFTKFVMAFSGLDLLIYAELT